MHVLFSTDFTLLKPLENRNKFGSCKVYSYDTVTHSKTVVHGQQRIGNEALVLFSLFFQPEQYFSLTTNQPTVFFSRLISTAERGLQYTVANLLVLHTMDL
jgi:hypothetical protein